MADRYWVGGAGTWDATSTTNWSATAGGAGGASAPTTADSVFFDRTGAYTVAVSGSPACLNMTVSAGTPTFSNTASPTLTIAGSLTMSAGTWSGAGTINFTATSSVTINTGNRTIPSTLVFNGVGGTWTLGSAFTSTSSMTFTNGTFTTNNFALNTRQLAGGGGTSTLNLGSSLVTISSATSNIPVNFTSGLTLNAGTSTIASGSADFNWTFNGGGNTFWTIFFTSCQSFIINGANTFQNVYLASGWGAATRPISFGANQIINGILQIVGEQASSPVGATTNRVSIRSTSAGVQRTLTVNGLVSFVQADVQDIVGAGTAAPFNTTRSVDLGNNSGVNFTSNTNRYWVGGTATTVQASPLQVTGIPNQWAFTSGGPAGAGTPGPLDDAFFNAASGASTVTVGTNFYVKNLTLTGFTGTLAGSNGVFAYGNVVLTSAFTNSGAFTFGSGGGANTVTTAGRTLTSATFGTLTTGDTTSWTLQDALSTGGTLTVTSGTFTTNNFNVTAANISSSNTNTRTINLGSSTVALLQSTAVNFQTTTNLTFNAGTSQINLTNTANTQIAVGSTAGGGVTFNNVSFTGVSATSYTITGQPCIFNNLSFVGRTTAGITPVSIGANQTINGTLTLSAGTNATMRTFVQSNTIGTTRTLTCAAFSATDADFRDITISGSAAPVSGTRLGDCKGNSGITFDAAKTVYFRNTASNNWGASTSWSFTNGGAIDSTAFPLAQDTAVFPSATYPASGSTITINAAYNIGTIDMSARTSNTMTLSTGGNAPTIYGSWINGTGTTLSGTATLTFSGRGSQTITSAGKTFQPLAINSPGGSVTLQDALTISSATGLTLTNGSFNANNYNVTTPAFNSATTTSSGLTLGNGTWTVNGSGAVWTVANLPIVTDASPTAASLSAAGTAAYSSLTPVGSGGSVVCTAVGDFVTGLNNDDISNSDWTLEAWIYVTAYTGTTWGGQMILVKTVPATVVNLAELDIGLNNTGKLSYGVRATTGATSFNIASVNSVPLNSWVHVAVCMTNSTSTLRFFINGVLDSTVTSAPKGGGLTTSRYSVGQFGNGLQLYPFSGLITQARVSNSARYTTTFTPPTAPFSPDANTLFLLNQADRAVVTNGSTGTISLTSASAKTFNGGSVQTYPTLSQGGAGALTVAGFNKFANITNTAIGNVLFTGGTINDFTNFNLNGTSTAARLTLGSTNTSQAILRKPTAWNVGAGSLDNGNNTGLSFTAGGGIDFLSISYINGQVANAAIFAYISETSSGTDAVSARVVFRSSASETATGTDTASAQTIFIANINESGSATDLISALRVYLAAILESASGADSVASRYIAQPSVAETGTATDAATTRFTGRATVSETATATEIVRGGLRYLASLSETATASDVLSATQAILRSIAESASGTDTTSARYTTSPTIAESATATDRLTAISRFVTAIAESGTASDVVSALRVLTGRVAETATASDIDSALAVFRAQIAEGLSAADAVAVAASTFNARVTETATETDTPNAQAAFRATATDTATGTDTVAPRYIALPQVSETATGTETVAARALFAPSIAETATISDQSRVAPSVFNAITLAVAQLSDQVSPPGSIYNAPVRESATATDSLIGAYLWNLIDDAQNPDWGAINTAQNPAWAVADTAQPAGWTVIQNPQTPGWSTIDDSQTPGWQNTDTLN